MSQTTAGETEQERQRLAGELAADYGPDWPDRYRPGTFGCHELLDRVHLIEGQLERDVLTHPACVANAEWFALAGQAADLLRQLYQRVGADHV
jgi:hypothetical protein